MKPVSLGPFPVDSSHAEAVTRDVADPLRRFREEFARPDPDLIYLDGNCYMGAMIATHTIYRYCCVQFKGSCCRIG